MLKVAWSSEFVHPLPKSHRFPMSKYEMLPQQLLYEGTLTKDNFFKPDLITEENILHTHEKYYWLKLKNGTLSKSEIRKTGFPFSQKLVVRERHIVNGTLKATKYAMENGIAMNIAGGTHHAFTNRGEGFCLLNDIAIASNYLLNGKIVSKILVVDLDVHQGNGTAEIFQNEPRVFTFSMHGKNNYPLKKEHSDLDISLPDFTPDSFYLPLLNEALARLMDEVRPEFVFFQSGVDVLETDKLGKLSLTIQGCKMRDEIVLKSCKENSIPTVVSMGGGYSYKFQDIIEAHSNTYRLAQEIYF